MLLALVLRAFDDNIKDFLGGYGVVISKMIVSSCFFVDVKCLYFVKMNTFLNLHYLHNIVHISKIMHVL